MGKTAYQRESEAKTKTREYESKLQTIERKRRELITRKNESKARAYREHQQSKETLRSALRTNQSNIQKTRNDIRNRETKIQDTIRTNERNLNNQKSRMRDQIQKLQQEQDDRDKITQEVS